MQYCRTLFLSECSILLKVSVELECPPEALRSTAHHPVLADIHWTISMVPRSADACERPEMLQRYLRALFVLWFSWLLFNLVEIFEHRATRSSCGAWQGAGLDGATASGR